MPSHATVPVVDIRPLAPRQRHPLVFSTFVGLGQDEAMELVVDHDPDPVHRSFQVALPGKFGWQVLEGGPDVWRIRITSRLAPAGHGGR